MRKKDMKVDSERSLGYETIDLRCEVEAVDEMKGRRKQNYEGVIGGNCGGNCGGANTGA